MKTNGIIVVNKDENMTSRDVVNVLTKVFNTKSIGHIGTLDPLAKGVLVCLIGKYTKLANILVNHDKEYIASFKLGILTDTLDITGNILKEEKFNVDKEKLINILNNFPKKYMQEVPIYSAVKVAGKKLYEYAREGISVDLPKKEVNIYSLELIEINNDIITIKCHVSKGTYIRSLIRDIAKELNTYGTMTDLVRIKLGKFDINNSYNLEDIQNNKYHLLDLKDIFDIEEVNLNEIDYKKIKNGNKIEYQTDKYILFKYNKEDIALYQKLNEKEIKPLIMF